MPTHTIFESREGRINKTITSTKTTYNAWDFRGEYLGRFDTEDYAREAIREAREVYEALAYAYSHRR